MNRQRLAASVRHRVARDAVPRTVREAARAVEAEVWLVGGYVRDAALGRRATDVDLTAGRGAARLVDALQGRWSTGGFRFRKRGVTTWRFQTAGREVDLVDASRRGLDGDLERRDFTINAIAYDLLAGTIHDPLRGLADLRAHRLRLPRPGVVREDPLRALRAARFLAQLPGFELERDSRREIAAAAAGLRRATHERIGHELDKLLVAEAPVRGLEALVSLGLLGSVLPELLPLANCQAGAERPDVWRHTLDAMARCSSPGRLPGGRHAAPVEARRLLRWSLLLHDISKPETLMIRADGRPTFHGHEALGAQRADLLLERLHLPKATRRRIGRLILNHLRPSHLADAGAPARGMARLVRESGDDLPLLVVHAACDALASGSPVAEARRRWPRLRAVLLELLERAERRRRVRLPRLVTGQDVMRESALPPGPRVGRLLARVSERQEEGLLTTRAQALKWLRRQRP